jgi:hypothetical protein
MLLSKFKLKHTSQIIIWLVCFLHFLSSAQNKLGIIKYNNLQYSAGSNISYYNGKIISQSYHVLNNKEFGRTIVYSTNLDTIQTIEMSVPTPTNSDFINLQSVNSLKPVNYGLSFTYKQGYLSTILFKATNSLVPDTFQHKAYASKNYTNRITNLYQLQDSTFVGSSIVQTQLAGYPRFGLWWLNKNLDTVRNVFYDYYFLQNGGNLLRNIYELPKKELLLGGFTDSLDAYDGLVMRVDSLGNIKFGKSIGTDAYDALNFIKIKNSYYLYGLTNKFGSTTNDFNRLLLIKIDSTGNVVYSKSISNGEGIFSKTNNAINFNNDILIYGSQFSLEANGLKGCLAYIVDTNGIVKKYHKATYNPVIGSQNKDEWFTNAVLDSIKNIYFHYFYYDNTISDFQTGLVKLDSNLVGCIPSVVQSFTTTDVTSLVHSVPINYTVKRDSLIRVTGTIIQTYGIPGITEDCSAYVGLQEYSIQNQFIKLYPNPSTGLFNYELLDANSMVGDYTMEVYNTVGAMIKHFTINKNSLQGSIDLTEFSNGIYFIKIINKNKILFNTKLSVIK